MIKDYKLYNKMASAFNSTFGTSGPGEAGRTFQSVKFDIIDDDTIKAKYVSEVAFPANSNVEELKKRFSNEAIARIEAALKKAQDNFAKLDFQGVDKKKISFKMDNKKSHDEIEYLNVASPTRRAFYKYICEITVK